MKIKKIKFYLVIFCAFIFTMLTGCSKYTPYSRIQDYDNYLSNLIKYSDTTQTPNIDTFLKLYKEDFDYAKPFNGFYTYVTVSDKNYLMSFDGIREESKNYDECEMLYDKFIFSSNDLKGLKDTFGNILLEPIYTSISIKNNIVLCIKENGEGIVFKINNKDCEIVSEKLPGDTELIDENTLKSFNVFYNLKMQRKTCINNKNYYINSTLNCGMYIIENKNTGLFGFANEDNKIIIDPIYDECNEFIDNYALVKLNGVSHLINLQGRVVISQDNNKMPLYFNGKYMIYEQKNKYFIADLNYNLVVNSSFLNIKNTRIYNDYLILENNYKYTFYSLEKQEKSIEYCFINFDKNYFIVTLQDKITNKNVFSLYDKNLNLLVKDCDYISFDYNPVQQKNLLLIKKDNKYQFYLEAQE